MSKMFDQIRETVINDMIAHDPKGMFSEQQIMLLAVAAEHELSMITVDLAQLFTPEEQKTLDVNQTQIMILNAMLVITKEIMRLRKENPKALETMIAENRVEMESLAKTMAVEEITKLFTEKMKKPQGLQLANLPTDKAHLN